MPHQALEVALTAARPRPRTLRPTAHRLRSHSSGRAGTDFFETVTLTGTWLYVFAVIEHATRRIRVVGATAHPTAAWVAQRRRTSSWTSRTPAAGHGS